MKPITPHVTIKRGNGKIVIHSGYTIFHTQFPDSKRISCAIPAYDIYYSAEVRSHSKSSVEASGGTTMSTPEGPSW